MVLFDLFPVQLPFSSGSSKSVDSTSTATSHHKDAHSSHHSGAISRRHTPPPTAPLVVRVGPHYDQLQTINVNDDRHPLLIDSPYFTGRLVVRIRDFNGVTPAGQEGIRDTEYFGKRRRKFSIQVEGRFKQPVDGDDLYFGTDFDYMVPVPSIFEIGMSAARMIDPAVFYDMQAKKPYIMSPLLCCINTMRIKPAPEQTPEQPSKETNSTASDDTTTSPLLLNPYELGGATEIEENTLLDMEPDHDGASLPYKKRRKMFLDQEARRRFVFSPDKEYGFDFFSPHMDFNTFNLKLGISVNVKKYLGGHPVRYTCRSRDGNTVFFVVQFELPDESVSA